jgi:hypothetical protein
LRLTLFDQVAGLQTPKQAEQNPGVEQNAEQVGEKYEDQCVQHVEAHADIEDPAATPGCEVAEGDKYQGQESIQPPGDHLEQERLVGYLFDHGAGDTIHDLGETRCCTALLTQIRDLLRPGGNLSYLNDEDEIKL